MITSNVIERTFRINCKGRIGTCFAITVNNEKYLITARHIVKEIEEVDIVSIYHNNEWVRIPVHLIKHASPLIDISVLTADLDFSSNAPLPASREGFAYGQDVYFLGFPNVVDIDQASSLGMKMNRDFPMPIVKQAIYSGIGDDNHFFIDGYGNRGFSGGPVVFRPRDSKDYQVAGVIINYKPEIIPVYELQSENNEEERKIIGYFEGNSGIITVSWIQHAIDLIQDKTLSDLQHALSLNKNNKA